jgi:hypothetical protein
MARHLPTPVTSELHIDTLHHGQDTVAVGGCVVLYCTCIVVADGNYKTQHFFLLIQIW